jgi:hypothetical protein
MRTVKSVTENSLRSSCVMSAVGGGWRAVLHFLVRLHFIIISNFPHRS